MIFPFLLNHRIGLEWRPRVARRTGFCPFNGRHLCRRCSASGFHARGAPPASAEI